MGTRVTVRIEGMEELRGKLRRLGAETRAVLNEAAQAGAEVIRQEAQSRAPGPWIAWERSAKASRGMAVEVDIGPDKDHWYYQFLETGTGPHEINGRNKKAVQFMGRTEMVVRRSVKHKGHAARPFLRPAIDEGKDAATKAVGAVLKRAIESVK